MNLFLFMVIVKFKGRHQHWKRKLVRIHSPSHSEESEPSLIASRASSLKGSFTKIPTLEFSGERNWLVNWQLLNLESRSDTGVVVFVFCMGYPTPASVN